MKKKYGVFGTGFDRGNHDINYEYNVFLESFDTQEEAETFIKDKPSHYKVYSIVTVYINDGKKKGIH